MVIDWYHRRWGYFSQAKGRKDKIGVAKRKLKYNCSKCRKPIEKGQKYVIRHSIVDLGYHIKEYYHFRCLFEND